MVSRTLAIKVDADELADTLDSLSSFAQNRGESVPHSGSSPARPRPSYRHWRPTPAQPDASYRREEPRTIQPGSASAGYREGRRIKATRADACGSQVPPAHCRDCAGSEPKVKERGQWRILREP